MKKTFLLLSILCLSFINAQEKSVEKENLFVPIEERKKEVKLNGLMLVLGAFDVSYERFLTD